MKCQYDIRHFISKMKSKYLVTVNFTSANISKIIEVLNLQFFSQIHTEAHPIVVEPGTDNLLPASNVMSPTRGVLRRMPRISDDHHIGFGFPTLPTSAFPTSNRSIFFPDNIDKLIKTLDQNSSQRSNSLSDYSPEYRRTVDRDA